MFRLRTFGGCFLERDGVRLDGLSGQRKGLGLLALLAAAGDAGLSRDTASAYLWPESDESRAGASLKQLVHSIRLQLASADVLLGPNALRLNPALVTSDVAEFRAALARSDANAAVALYGGPFLDGFLLRGADGFERWAAGERASLAAPYGEALERLAEHAAAGGDARSAVEWWRRRQAADPLSGRVAVGLMRSLDAGGDRAGALRHAQIHESLLRQDVGPTAANPLVVQLAAELERAEPVMLVPPVTSAPPALMDAEQPQSGTVPPTLPPAPRQPRRAALTAVGVLAVMALGGYAVQREVVDVGGGVAAAQPGESARARADLRRSVAVLPFANTSGDPADEPFATD